MIDLRGKVAVITGGTRGLGYAIALELARCGASVLIGSRNPEAVQNSIKALQELGFSADGLAGDVSDLSYVQKLASKALDKFGGLDIWVNNAGTAGPYGPTLEISISEYKKVISTNILGVYHGSIVAMEPFLKQGHGKLINILGHGWNGPVAFQNAYAPTKIWAKNFTLGLAKEYEKSGVNIFAFNRGMVSTELLTHGQVIAGYEDKLKSFPMVVRILAKPAEIPARKVALLASSASDGKTGQVIQVPDFSRTLTSVIKILVAKLLKRRLPPIDIQMESIPGGTQMDQSS